MREDFNEVAVSELFQHHDGLHAVRVYNGPPTEEDAPKPFPSIWRRSINGLEIVADEDLAKEWLEQDQVHYFNRKGRLLFKH